MSFPIAGRTVVYIVLSLVPGLAAYGVLLLIARVRRSALWLVPGWVAAAALAPVIATFFAVRLVIRSLQGMAMSGGGLSAVSAELWEATQPLIAASWLACALLAVTLVIAVRAALNQEDDETETSSGAAILSVLVLTLAAVAVVSTTLLFHNTNSIILDVLDPNAQQGSIAEVSTLLSRRLLLTAATSVAMALALLLAVVFVAAVRPTHEPRAAFAQIVTLVVLLGVIAMFMNAFVHRARAARLYNTAVTGQFSP